MIEKLLKPVRPREGNDIREMADKRLFRKVTFYFGLFILSSLSVLVTSPGDFTHSIALFGVAATFVLTTPGAIELHYRAGEKS